MRTTSLFGVRRSLRLVLCLGAIALAACAHVAQERPPNIVFLVADDLGYGGLGVQGDREVRTPHIDAIAGRGIRLTNYYANHHVCAPSRAALLTGVYQHRMGFEYNPGGSGPNFGLPTDTPTVAERLKQQGYATALFGKWHLGQKPEHHPNARGFDNFYGFLGGTHPYALDGVTQYNATDADDARTPRVLRQRERADMPAHMTEALGDEAVRFIGEHKHEPFFVMLSFNAPHVPMQTTQAYHEKFSGVPDLKRRLHLAMMSVMDDQVGRVVDTLKREGLERNTLLVFISDNGGPQSQTTSSNYPLSGDKGSFWEGGIRVPALVQWPGKIEAGRVLAQSAISTDMTATALALAGALPAQGIDGVNLMPWLQGARAGQPVHEALYWRAGNQGAIRQGDWKLIKRGEQWSLFNLVSDIGERMDLATSQPQRVADMRAAWLAWSTQMKPPAWVPGRSADAALPPGKL